MSDADATHTVGGLAWPVLVLSCAMFLMVAFQTFMLIKTGENLRTVRAAQEQPIQDGTKIRQRLETLAGRTAALAQEGNTNAQVIVETMRRQGVNMTPVGQNAVQKATP